jgi:GT2 family glycosyltransferase
MTLGTLPAFWRPKAPLQIQSILYNTDLDDVERTIEALARAVELAITGGVLSRTVVRFGDSSSLPVLDERGLERLRKAADYVFSVEYDFFGSNLGSARGHNRLVAQAEDGTHFLWIQNPDIVVSPRLFFTVLEPFRRAGVGQVEAKQIPIEHPKEYDLVTGETEWTTTACVMTPLPLFREIGGFDADSFFMYCDDVDLAMRIRELGYRTLFQPAAVCFHDKRLSDDGKWQPSSAEHYYSAEAGLMMAHKWSYPEKLKEILAYFEDSGEPALERAARVFRKRESEGTLPPPRDPAHQVAKFNGHFYAKHRFPL